VGPTPVGLIGYAGDGATVASSGPGQSTAVDEMVGSSLRSISMSSRRNSLLCGVLAAVALVSGCSSERVADARPNVVLVLVDTTRADRLSLYGYPRKTTPHLERLAAAGVVFEVARSQAACTFPSVNSLLTSRMPHHFFAQPLGDWSIPSRISSIAEILRAHGYATYAVSASSVVRANPSRMNRTGGYGRGFDVFDESCERRPGRCVSQRARSLVRRSAEPYFLYLHFMDPHHPYAAPGSFRHHFAKPGMKARRIRNGDPKPLLESLYKHGEHGERGEWARQLAYLSDSYDDEIRYFDTVLESLWRRLVRGDDGRGTIVVLASDHGEDFLEHEHLMHCRSLYETSIRVPLVMWLPGVGGRRIEAPVENLDVVPTLLDYLGIDATPYGLEGRSLRPEIEGRGDPGSTTVAVQSSFRAIVSGRHKLIYDLAADRGRLFDVVADPGEEADLSASRPEVAADLRRRTLERVSETESRGDPGRAFQVSEKVQQGLRARGYLD
jgi:arylsulfatase A-like enzyme